MAPPSDRAMVAAALLAVTASSAAPLRQLPEVLAPAVAEPVVAPPPAVLEPVWEAPFVERDVNFAVAAWPESAGVDLGPVTEVVDVLSRRRRRASEVVIERGEAALVPEFPPLVVDSEAPVLFEPPVEGAVPVLETVPVEEGYFRRRRLAAGELVVGPVYESGPRGPFALETTEEVFPAAVEVAAAAPVFVEPSLPLPEGIAVEDAPVVDVELAPAVEAVVETFDAPEVPFAPVFEPARRRRMQFLPISYGLTYPAYPEIIYPYARRGLQEYQFVAPTVVDPVVEVVAEPEVEVVAVEPLLRSGALRQATEFVVPFEEAAVVEGADVVEPVAVVGPVPISEPIAVEAEIFPARRRAQAVLFQDDTEVSIIPVAEEAYPVGTFFAKQPEQLLVEEPVIEEPIVATRPVFGELEFAPAVTGFLRRQPEQLLEVPFVEEPEVLAEPVFADDELVFNAGTII